MAQKNLGKIVAKTMLKKGTRKIHLVKLLKISRPTFNTRLIDGCFTEHQIYLLTKEGFLPQPPVANKR